MSNQNNDNNDFTAISLSIASPDQIKSWSYGEITKPETINYRTQKPELDGLFCERIFGPTKNWECYCGKYKRIRYRGIICEKCGVEVTRSIVRRERMGHISLAVPVAHIWFFRSTPSRLGLLLDLPIRLIEQIIYFASYIITDVDLVAKEETLERIDKEFKEFKKNLIDEEKKITNKIKNSTKDENPKQDDLDSHLKEYADKMESLVENHNKAREELNSLEKNMVLTEIEYREMNMKFGHVFVAGTGAESIRKILEEVDLNKKIEELKELSLKSSGQKLKKLQSRIRFFSSLTRAGVDPKWMMITELPVIPPDLRPMVQLDGGRFAASDLNDLYRRIINRNNRLKRLINIGAPEIICRNEKRMLQEAVDTLINNSPRAGKAVFSVNERAKLKSLSDMLKGKQGRFRQNLLGKRVDYSGRSVIVVGPKLKLNECGLPKTMAMKLFKPFVIGELIKREIAHNVKSAERVILSNRKVVWDILEDVIKGRYVLLNRAPTLHRLGIQAFQPKLIEGKAIQIHPLVCSAFNADFDGDQMAVHLPLSNESQKEAREIVSSAKNLLKPSAGKPVVTPSQDIILGCYFLTSIYDGKKGEGKVFVNKKEALNYFDLGVVDIQAKIKVRIFGKIIETSIGRIIFNDILPDIIGFKNQVFKNKDLENLTMEIFEKLSVDETAILINKIKNIGFKYATYSGISIGKDDMIVPDNKSGIIDEATKNIDFVLDKYKKGFITDNERYVNSINIWSKTKKNISNKMIENYNHDKENDILCMVDSGARGNWGQITQLSGMKGLVANPSGKTIEVPIKSNFKEGFSILEYFISTHGGRKGKSDTALKTAEAGYLTRKLVDTVQDIIIRENDCGQEHCSKITRAESDKIGESFENRVFGRTLAKDLIDKFTGEVLVEKGNQISYSILRIISEKKVDEVDVFSVMTCKTSNGICQKCYGYDLGNNKLVEIGVPVGIIAAQSIGEPGTQLTMRTFHMGGVAGEGDITQGLSRVEEIFESRTPKTKATLSEISGIVDVRIDENVKVTISADSLGIDKYKIDDSHEIFVKEGTIVKANQILSRGKTVIRARFAGKVISVNLSSIEVQHTDYVTKEYIFSLKEGVIVETGNKVKAGDPLTKGHLDVKQMMDLVDIYDIQKYLMTEIQTIYSTQGQSINDKHIEIIVKKMFSRVKIIDPGDMENILSGEITDYQFVLNENEKLKASGKREATFERLLLGLTRVSLLTDSWLSAASFQETVRVLVDAATTNKVDHLEGLKENVIIGKLIPAGETYRKKLGL